MIETLLQRHGLQAPDGRPLYAYNLENKAREKLAVLLKNPIRQKDTGRSTAAAFVLWAAERIRIDFQGGSISWKFVFEGLGLPPNQAQATDLVERGLLWWRRRVRRSEAGQKLYLFTLMAEGGLPDALLAQETHYHRALTGAVAEIEKGRCISDDASRYSIAARWAQELPQTFRTDDSIRLLADLAGAMAQLRAELPDDLPMDAADRWLDINRPGWSDRLPLRLSDQAANGLIRGALKSDRAELDAPSGPIACRELRRQAIGGWSGWLRTKERGELGAGHLPGAQGLRLRLLPAGPVGGGLVYAATPSSGGWELRRMGGAGAVHLPLRPDRPFLLAAFSDGAPQGEIQIAPALSLDDGAYSLWHAADPAAPGLLLPLSGSARTRQPALWILVGSKTPVSTASPALRLSGPDPCEGGSLWVVEGEGVLHVGSEIIRVRTSAETDAPQANLTVGGATLHGWRSAHDGSLVIRGEPRFLGSREGGALRSLPRSEYTVRPGRGARLGERICVWSSGEEMLARVRYVSLSADAVILLREVRQGCVSVRIEGLPPGLQIRLAAGSAETIGRTGTQAIELVLDVPGAPPGLVRLSVWDAQSGGDLHLVAPWPAKAGMILDPDGGRLTHHRPLAIEDIRGWRAVTPGPADLQFNLVGANQRIALGVSGEIPLALHAPLIRSLLAQGGPDAQVNVKLIVGGDESRRLEVRRYCNHAQLIGNRVHFGLPRDTTSAALVTMPAVPVPVERQLVGCAVNLEDPTRKHEFDELVSGPADLSALLPQDPGPWLIQARLEGRRQRAIVWGRIPPELVSRSDRIAAYQRMWRDLLASPMDPRWQTTWTLVRSVSEEGDAGVLDQVQALAQVPAAAITLMLRVGADQVSEVLALDLAAPIFWPTVAVKAFGQAVACELARQVARYRLVFDAEEARENAATSVQKAVGVILRVRPELGGHFASAFVENDLDACCLIAGVVTPLGHPTPLAKLRAVANEAVARSDRLPNGLSGLQPASRPDRFEFNPYAQPVIDAPLIAAEVALGRRERLARGDMLKLINLRLVDPVYFDAALPFAIQNGASECAHDFKRPLTGSPSGPRPALSAEVVSSRSV